MIQWVFVAGAAAWPLIAFAGGLGFAPLIMLCALLCLPATFKRFQGEHYMIAVMLALEFIMASARWSPQPVSLLDLDFARGKFAVKSEVLRVGMDICWAAVLIQAAKSLSPAEARRIIRVLSFALLTQLVIVGLLAALEQQALALFYPDPASRGEGVQNISRNGIVMALAAPMLIVATGRAVTFRRALIIEIAVFVAVIGVLLVRDVQGGILSVAAGLFAVAVVRLFPTNGFRVLGLGISSIVLLTPAALSVATRNADAIAATTSAEWRLAIWRKVIEVIDKDPWFGQGIGVLRTMRERIPAGVFKDQLYVPNHAHNMVLQLWAEVGAIGALLVALAIVLVGFRLPAPRMLGVAGFLGAALAGQFTAVAFVSFDLWNDWWWSAAGFIAAFSVVMYQAERIDTPSRVLVD